MEKIEQLPGSGLRLIQDTRLFLLGTDSVRLSRFAPLHPGDRVFDLGCGVGVLPILLLERQPNLLIRGIDCNPDAVSLANRNMAENGFSSIAQFTVGDLCDRTALPAGAFDLVISNPPYFAAGTGFSSPSPSRAYAREELGCTVDDLCAAAARLLRWGGRFALVYRAERLCDLFCALRASGLEPKRLQHIAHHPDSPPSLVLLEAMRGGKPGLQTLPLLCTGENH